MQKEVRFDAVLFDLDGTIIDSAPGIFDTILFTLEKYGIRPPRESLGKYLGPPLRQTFAEFVPEEEVEQALSTYRAEYAQKGLYTCSVYAGVEEMLTRLYDAGLTICLATSKPKSFGETILDYFHLTKYFDFIGGATMDGRLDTKAAVIREVLEQPCMNGKTPVMVGDRFHDLEGAKLCNLPAIAVLYGYGTVQEFAPYAPKYIVKTTQDLCKRLLANY